MKNIYITIATILLALPITAQEQIPKNRFYFSIHSGYNFSSGNTESVDRSFSDIGFDGGNSEVSATETVKTVMKINFGSGINYGASFGYNYNKYLGAEIAVSYLKSKSEVFDNRTNIFPSTLSISFNSKMLQIIPSLKFSAGYEKINPYIKFGLILGSGSISNNKQFKILPATREWNYLIDGGLAIGYTGAFGVDYKVSDNIAISLDANFINLTYHPKRKTLTKYLADGADSLPFYPLRGVEINFIDDIENDGTYSGTSGRELTPSYAFGSFGFNLGVKYGF